MDSELSEISVFIQNIPPFDSLPKQILANLVRQFSINYVSKGESLPPKGINESSVYILRKGAISCFSIEGELINRLGKSDLCDAFYHTSANANNDTLETNLSFIPQTSTETSVKIRAQKVQTDEDSLVYSVNVKVLKEIGEHFPRINDFFNKRSAQRLTIKSSKVNKEAILPSTLMNTSLSNFYHSPIATISASKTIQQAAVQMNIQGYSSLVVTEDTTPVGIITNKDIRRRCVAEGLPITESIRVIMSNNVSNKMSTIDYSLGL